MREGTSRRRASAGRRAALLLAACALALSPAGSLAEEEAEKGPVVRAWQEGGPPETSVDVVFVGDGYQRQHLSRTGKYARDVNRYARRFLEEAPFSWYRKRFNVHAVYLESHDAGVGGDTALQCRYLDDRRLRFSDEAALEAAVGRAPAADICLVMVNAEEPGGCGSTLASVQVRGRPLPAPTFSAQDTISFLTALHELGHSFAGLGDEYVDDPMVATFALPEEERTCPTPTSASRPTST